MKRTDKSNPRRRRRSTDHLGDLLRAKKPSAPAPESDWVALVHSIAAADQQALHALYERMSRPVYTLIMRILDDREAAEEVAVDVFHSVWQRAATFDPAHGTVVGWLMNLARSRAIDRWRFERRKKRTARDGTVRATAVSDPRDDLSAREQEALLRKALAAVTSNERRAIELAYFSGRTYAEAALELKQPLGTVKTRIRSGLAKLRRALHRQEDGR